MKTDDPMPDHATLPVVRIGDTWYRTIWPAAEDRRVEIIDQTLLPHRLHIALLSSLDDAVKAIEGMQVRGAPLVGATAAYGICLAVDADPSHEHLVSASSRLAATRPTAVNLRWALDRLHRELSPMPEAERSKRAWEVAGAICDEDVAICRAIGDHGLRIVRTAAEQKDGAPVNVLTHCNAGWLATVDWGTALAPIYLAHDSGVPVHVWVDETRPRNQGAALTAFELAAHGVPHTLISDNSGGHLMQRGLVDLCLVGTDRTTRTGDVANKIGTYLKALAAHDNGVPFYVALPSTTIDWKLVDGIAEIPIEQRDPNELVWVRGRTRDGESGEVEVAPSGCRARNDAFDVTPSRLVTAFITERGVCEASELGLVGMFPDLAAGKPGGAVA